MCLRVQAACHEKSKDQVIACLILQPTENGRLIDVESKLESIRDGSALESVFRHQQRSKIMEGGRGGTLLSGI